MELRPIELRMLSHALNMDRPGLYSRQLAGLAQECRPFSDQTAREARASKKGWRFE